MIDALNPDFSNTPVSPRRPAFSYDFERSKGEPVLTIVTPFYNVKPIFHETARSIKQQSLQQWEWVIVNDGTTDPESLSALEMYRNCDPRIHVIDHDSVMGIGAARNTGFRTARSEYVLLLDSDALLEPTAAEKWLWFLTTHPEYAFVNSFTVNFGNHASLNKNGFHTTEILLRRNMLTSNALFRKDVHSSSGGYDESIDSGFEDWEFWVRCADHGYSGYTIPEYLLWYRNRKDHLNRWKRWFVEARQSSLRRKLSQRYPRVREGFSLRAMTQERQRLQSILNELPFNNRLCLPMNKRRLIMIVAHMTMGGADKFNLDLMRELADKGWEITVATTLDYPQISWVHKFSQITPDIFILPNFLGGSDHPRFLRYLIESRQSEIVLISNSELAYHALPYLRRWCPRTTFIDYCHAEEEWKNGGYPGFSVKYQKYLDLTVVTSNHLKDWMVKRGADSNRIEICYVNVDPEYWRPNPLLKIKVRNEFSISSKTILILYAGRLAAEKQPQVFARVMNSLQQSNLEFISLVAGDGAYRDWLRSYIRNHQLSGRVKLLGAVPSERMQELMNAADIFFLPSRREGIALTIYEAMASGVVVVGANVGGQRELVDEGSGILLDTSDEDREVHQYSDVLTRLIGNSEERKRLGERARARITNHFHLDRMGEKMLSLFDKASREHLSQLHTKGENDIFDSKDLMDYVNSFVPLEYFPPDRKKWRSRIAGLFTSAYSCFTSAYKYYKGNGLIPMIKRSFQYLDARIHRKPFV